MKLSNDEISELQESFSDLLNYDAADPTQPIDPINYRAPDGDTCLHIAAARNDTRAIQLLLKAGVDANVRGDMDSTPLHYAVSAGHDEAAEFLILNGASPTARNAFGSPATPRSRY